MGRAVFAVIVALLAAACATGVHADQGTGAVSVPHIASVVFEQVGTSSPLVVIRGSGFGVRPRSNPSYQPTPPNGNVPPYGCNATGDVGWDYGTQLWVSFTTTTGRPLWSAGRYRPSLHELDCVGISRLKYSPTKITFHFGAAGLRALGAVLNRGYRYTVSVKGAVKQGTVT
jgi:hypothetical protein